MAAHRRLGDRSIYHECVSFPSAFPTRHTRRILFVQAHPETAIPALRRDEGAASVEQQDQSTRIPSGKPQRARWRRTSRLRASGDFQRVRRRGRTTHGRWLIVGYARAEAVVDGGVPPTRIGFSVSRRVGGAVVRNQVKRRLREIARKRLSHVAPGWDIVITARASAAEAEYGALEEDVRETFSRARLWRTEEQDTA